MEQSLKGAANLSVRPNINFFAIFKLITDAFTVLPAAEASFAMIETILADIKMGKMPALTPAEMALLMTDLADVKKLLADVKAVLA